MAAPVSAIGGLETVQTVPSTLPTKTQVLKHKVLVFFGQRWPELVTGSAALVLGVLIGVGMAIGIFPVPPFAFHVTTLTPFDEWTACNVTCGSGYESRRREFVYDENDDGTHVWDKDSTPIEKVELRSCSQGKCCMPGVSHPLLPHCYQVTTSPQQPYGVSWLMGRERAGRRGPDIDSYGKRAPDNQSDLLPFSDGELASIHTHQENEFIFYLARDYHDVLKETDDPGQYWLGLRCYSLPTKCWWSDGSSVGFLNFALNYENLNDGPLCAYIDVNINSSFWYLDDCANRRPFVRKSWNLSLNNTICTGRPNHCYESIPGNLLNWHEAVKVDPLVTIQSRAEWQNVLSKVLSGVRDDEKYWIGLKCDVEWPDKCYWIDGTSLSYDRIKGKSLNNITCVATDKNGAWFMEDCDNKHLAIWENQTRCDKVGFPQWTEWSVRCYPKKGQLCGPNRGLRYKLRWTTYPGVMGCPSQPKTKERQTRVCNVSCTGKLEALRPPMPKKLIPRTEEQCYSYNENLHGRNQMIAARLRDSEDYLMLFRVFNKSAYDDQDQTSAHPHKHPYRLRKTPNATSIGLKCIADKICYWVFDSMPIESLATNHDSVVTVNSFIDAPCEKWNLGSGPHAHTVSWFSYAGRCILLPQHLVSWQNAIHECLNFAPATILNSPFGNIAKHMVHFTKTDQSYIGLSRSDSKWYWTDKNGIRKVNASEDVRSLWTGLEWRTDPSLKCGVVDGPKSKFTSTDTQYIGASKCDVKLNTFCSYPGVSNALEFGYREFNKLQNSPAIVESEHLWRECRCKQYDGFSNADAGINVPFCYKVGTDSIQYQDFIFTTNSNISDIMKEAKNLDLVTIAHSAEENEVENVILEELNKHPTFDSADSCLTVYTESKKISFRGYCYVLAAEVENFLNQQYSCNQGPNGYLATINDNPLRNKLSEAFGTDAKTTLWYSGLHKANTSDAWRWMTGTIEKEPGWGVDEPIERGPNWNEPKCAIIDSKAHFTLRNVFCEETHRFVCESFPDLHLSLYKVTVTTGWKNIWNSPHVAKVYIQLRGEYGLTEIIPLHNTVDDLQTNKIFHREFEARNVGRPTEIIFSHRHESIHGGHAFDKGWHLGTVTLVEVGDNGTQVKYFAPVYQHIFVPGGHNDTKYAATNIQLADPEFEGDACAILKMSAVPNAFSLGSRCLTYFDRRLSRNEASEVCTRNNFGHLVTIKDRLTLEEIKKKWHGQLTGLIWIGLQHFNQFRSDHWKWVWMDKWQAAENVLWSEPYKYENMTHHRNDEYCAVMDMHHNGFLAGRKHCTNALPFICEFNVNDPCRNTVPQPISNSSFAYHDSCIVLFQTAKKFEAADKTCRDNGAHLVQITDSYMSEVFRENWNSAFGGKDAILWTGICNVPRFDVKKTWFSIPNAMIVDDDTLPFRLHDRGLRYGCLLSKWESGDTTRNQARLESVDRGQVAYQICQYGYKETEYNVTVFSRTRATQCMLNRGALKFRMIGTRGSSNWFFLPKNPNYNIIEWIDEEHGTFKFSLHSKDLGHLLSINIFVPDCAIDQSIFVSFVKIDGRSEGKDVQTFYFNVDRRIGDTSEDVHYLEAPKRRRVNRMPDVCDKNRASDWHTVRLGDHCYALTNLSYSYDQADAYCRSQNSRLVVTDSHEILILFEEGWKLAIPSFTAFVGLKREEDSWHWIVRPESNQQKLATNLRWAQGEPKPKIKDDGLCAVADPAQNFLLRNVLCNETYGKICQYGPINAKYYLTGMYCADPNTNRAWCKWNDGSQVSFSLLSQSDVSRAAQFEKENKTENSVKRGFGCVAIQVERLSSKNYGFKWVPWQCSLPTQPIFEYRRYCGKWRCDPKKDQCPKCGFGYAVQRQGWAKCRLRPAYTLLDQCCPAVIWRSGGETTVVTETARQLTGCLHYYGDIERCANVYNWCPKGGRNWEEWNRTTIMAHIATDIELQYMTQWLRGTIDQARAKVIHLIGASCVKTTSQERSKWFNCSWTLADADNSNLAFDSPFWAFPGRWKPYTTSMMTNLGPHPQKDTLPNRLCVGILSIVGYLSDTTLNPRIGKLVFTDCDKSKWPVILQTSKYFYDQDGNARVSQATTFPKFWRETPTSLEQLDQPIVQFLKNAPSPNL